MSVERANEIIRKLRIIGARVGVMHSAWESIYELECAIEGKKCALTGKTESIDEVINDLVSYYRKFGHEL